VQNRPKQPAKFIDVITGLRDFSLVTYAVAPGALAALLPAGFEPEIFRLNDGSECAFVSAAMFIDFGFHMPISPWPRLTFGQTNYRAYILQKGERGVWFFGTALDTPLVVIPKYAWQLPWYYTDIEIRSSWDGEVCSEFHYVARGNLGGAEVRMRGTCEPSGCLDGFVHEADTTEVLTHPLRGFFPRADGRVGTYCIWHDALKMTRCEIDHARFDVFERLGLVRPGAKPHSGLIQRETNFIIYLPPQVVRG
jgi:uncharacterized protein YqjF (DUF2071 family)